MMPDGLQMRLQHGRDDVFGPIQHDAQVLQLWEQARELQSIVELADEKVVATKQNFLFGRTRSLCVRGVDARMAFMNKLCAKAIK